MYCFLKDLFIKWYHFRISAKVAMKQLILSGVLFLSST